MTEMETQGESKKIDGQVELSMNSMVEFTSPHAMKFKGEIQGHPVMVLAKIVGQHSEK